MWWCEVGHAIVLGVWCDVIVCIVKVIVAMFVGFRSGGQLKHP